jgi:phosphoribosylformylglycinamidine synthase
VNFSQIFVGPRDLKNFEQNFGDGISGVVFKNYLFSEKLNSNEKKIAAEILTNEIYEQNFWSAAGSSPRFINFKNFNFAVKIAPRAGVTDSEGEVAAEIISEKLGKNLQVFAGKIYFLKFNETKNSADLKFKIETFAGNLANDLIEKIEIFPLSRGLKPAVHNLIARNLPRVILQKPKIKTEIDLEISDENLKKLGKFGVENRGPLALNLKQLQKIREYFRAEKRKPTDAEIETIAQTWSEHCRHTIFSSEIDEISDGLYKNFIRRATKIISEKKPGFCVSVFKDNSGAIAFDENFLITDKVETHNSPSALDPFGGAETGIVGVNRDCLGFGRGAKPIANRFGFFVGKNSAKNSNLSGANSISKKNENLPEIPNQVRNDKNDFEKNLENCELWRDRNLTKKILSPRKILDGIVAGIRAGGNESGIPTVGGVLFFDESYRGKPLVFAGTTGLIPREINLSSQKIFEKNQNVIPEKFSEKILSGISGTNSDLKKRDSGSESEFCHPELDSGSQAIAQRKFKNEKLPEIPDQVRNDKSILGHLKCAKNGDFIVTAGGATGADGIHGATFSSEILNENSPATAVQIGDPFVQKKVLDGIVHELRDENLFSAITDCGAGGFSSAVFEMACDCGGCVLDLKKAPTKYPNLAPWEILISESQERMIFAVSPEKFPRFLEIAKKYDFVASKIGKFKNSGKCEVFFGAEKVVDLDLNFLHGGNPPVKFQTEKKSRVNRAVNCAVNGEEKLTPEISRGLTAGKISQNFYPGSGNDSAEQKLNSDPGYFSDEKFRGDKIDFSAKNSGATKNTILQLLKNENICGRNFLFRQFDHEVQGSSVLKPIAGRGEICADATAIRPILNSKKAVVFSSGFHPKMAEISPQKMAENSIDFAIRAAVAAGAEFEKIALLDNFCWPSGRDPFRLWQLKSAARGCFDTAVNFGAPFISGKDSMFNDFSGFDAAGNPVKISVDPTLLISATAIADDFEKLISPEFKTAGDLIFILGATGNEFGGSIFAQNFSAENSAAPSVDFQNSKKLYENFSAAKNEKIFSAAQPINFGGAAISFAKMAIGGNFGAEIDFTKITGNLTAALFAETPGRIVATVAEKNLKKFEKFFGKIKPIGRVLNRGENLIFKNSAEVFAEFPPKVLRENYFGEFESF